MGFPIRMIQVDNGSEFVNDGNRTERESAFEKAAKTVLDFKSPNQVVSEYFSKCNICVDN